MLSLGARDDGFPYRVARGHLHGKTLQPRCFASTERLDIGVIGGSEALSSRTGSSPDGLQPVDPVSPRFIRLQRFEKAIDQLFTGLLASRQSGCIGRRLRPVARDGSLSKGKEG